MYTFTIEIELKLEFIQELIILLGALEQQHNNAYFNTKSKIHLKQYLQKPLPTKPSCQPKININTVI